MGKISYIAEYYDDEEKSLSAVLIIFLDENSKISMVIDSPYATWDGQKWLMDTVDVYKFNENNELTHLTSIPDSVLLNENPKTFQRNLSSVDEMTIANAKVFITLLKKSGRPYYEELSKYYRRFSFPFTIFIVLFFSISLGGKFKKNILLMSILFSLGIATLYYITEMITMMSAKWEYISPLAGAWLPIFIFAVLSILLLRRART